MAIPSNTARERIDLSTLARSDGRPVIGFVVWPQKGHIYPTFHLARKLRGLGADVWYFGARSAADIIKEQAFEFVAVAPDPDDPEFKAKTPSEKSKFIQAQIPRLVEEIKEAGLTHLFVDPLLHVGAIAALMAAVPVWYFWVMNPCYFRAKHRPFTYSTKRFMLPVYRHAPFLHWIPQFCFWRWWLHQQKKQKHYTLHSLTKDTAAKFGYEMVLTSYGYRADLPAIVLSPETFKHCDDKSTTYLGIGVDFSRREAPFAPPAGQRVVYVSLGTNFSQYPEAGRIIEAVCEAAREMPGVSFVIQIPESFRSAEPAGANVTMMTNTPALSILSAASAAITHGGFGAIKECISLGVPMLAVPFFYDQPANAIKLEDLGLGIAVSPKRVTATLVKSCLTRLFHGDEYKDRLQRFRENAIAGDRYDAFCSAILKVPPSR